MIQQLRERLKRALLAVGVMLWGVCWDMDIRKVVA